MLPVLAAALPNTCRCGANSASFVAAPEWRVRGCQSALSLVAKRWARRVAGLRNVRDVQYVREILRNSRTQCTSRTNTLAGTRLIGCLFVASWSLVLAKPGVVAKLNGLYGASAPHDDSREWRNWQTRWLQVPVLERAWGFKSPLAHEWKMVSDQEFYTPGRGPFSLEVLEKVLSLWMMCPVRGLATSGDDSRLPGAA